MTGEQERMFWTFYYDGDYFNKFQDGLGLENPQSRSHRLTRAALEAFGEFLAQGIPAQLALERAFSVSRRVPKDSPHDNQGEQADQGDY